MKKKKISFLLVLILLINNIFLIKDFNNFNSFAQQKGTFKQLVIGYFDTWCRSDGTTWLRYKGQIAKPGSTVKNINFPITEQAGYIVKDIDFFVGGKEEFDSIEYKGINSFSDFDTNYLLYSVSKNNVNLNKDKAIGKKDGIITFLNTLYIPTLDVKQPFKIKNDSWQSKRVQGWRYYIPIVVTFEIDPALVQRNINVRFSCENEIFEGQDVNFNDFSTATSNPEGLNEMSKEELIIQGIDGTSYYNKIPRNAYEIANKINPKIFLMAGKYKLTLNGWDTVNNTDTHTETVVVKKAEEEIKAEAVGIETSPPTGEIGKVFEVSAEKSFTNKGMFKKDKWQHYVSEGNDKNFKPISEGVKFNYIGAKEADYYFYATGETTEGLKVTTNVTKTSLKDNASANANAKIRTKKVWYEGLYEYVWNKSTIDIQGSTNDEINGTWNVDSKTGRRYSSNSWETYDLFESPKVESVNLQKKDFKSYRGGKARFNTIGEREWWLRVSGKGGSKDIDTKVVDVRALPFAQGEIVGNKKNREVIIYNKSLFKPKDSWQGNENGEIDDSKTVIKITNLKTGEIATSIGGKVFDKAWVKGLVTEFGTVDEGDYTHKKNDLTRIVFTGDHQHDQLTEIFKFEIEVTDKRGYTSHWASKKHINGDIKPVNRIDGIWNYIRNPFSKKAQTELYETSFSKDNDSIKVETREVETNKNISPVGINKKISYEPNEVGDIKIKNKAKDDFIRTVYDRLRKFLKNEDELESEKEYKLSIDNIAPSASLEGIKSENINLVNFIDTDNDISTQINDMTQDIFSETKTKIVNTNFVYREDKGTFKNVTNLRKDKNVEEKINEMIENDTKLKNLKDTSSFVFSNENEIYKYFYFFNDKKFNRKYNPYKNMNIDTCSHNFYFYRFNKILNKIEKINEKRLNSSIENWSYFGGTKHIDYYSQQRIVFLKDKMVILESRQTGKENYTSNPIYLVLNVFDYNGNNLLNKIQTEQLTSKYRYRGMEINVSSNLENLIIYCIIDKKKSSDVNWTISYNSNTNKIKSIETKHEFDKTSPYMMIDDPYNVARPEYFYFLVSDPESSLEKKVFRSIALDNFSKRREFKYFLIYNYFEFDGNLYPYYIDDVRKDFKNQKKIDHMDAYKFKVLGYEDDKIYIKKHDKSYIWDYKNDTELNNLIEIPSYNSVENKYSKLDFEDRYVKQYEEKALVPKMIDFTYKLNEEVNNFKKAKYNYMPIFINKDIMFGHLEILKMLERIKAFNLEHNLSKKDSLKPIIIDIGGQNKESFKELISSTNGLYLSTNSNQDGIDKLKKHLKTIAGVNKAKNSIRINQGDVLELKGASIDYESDPITLERYRLKGESWGNFGKSISKLQGNTLKFKDKGTFILEYQSKDNPPSMKNKDYGKFSNIASLIVQVGDGDLPAPPKIPPTIDVKILSADGEYKGKERRRLDFVIMAHEGTNQINWDSLKINFDKTDYLPTKSENNFTESKQFSRIFTTLGTHKIIVELSDIKGLPSKVEIPFEITKDLGCKGNFDIVGDGKRNPDTSLAQFFIDNESASSIDNDEFEIKYFEEVPKYKFENGKLIQNGFGWGELNVVGKMIETDNNIKIKQIVEENYFNGVGLNGENLDKGGYRIFKKHEVIKEKHVVKEPPKLEYKVNPKVIVIGESVTHLSDITDDTNKPKTQEFKFTHDPTILQNNKGVNPLNNTITKESTKTPNYKGLYQFYSKVTDEDGMTSNWVDGGTVKVVSKPVADFEPYTTSSDSKGSNLEYENDIFGKNSAIQLENKALNEDYGNTIQNYGFRSIKMEYRNIKDGDFTEFYNMNNLNIYPTKFTLPNKVSKENGIYEIKQTVVSIDGIEAECTKQIKVIDFRFNGDLEPQKIYPSQKYKIKAKTSIDSIGSVAYLPYSDTWITLNLVKKDSNKYWEAEISTLETMKDDKYPIELYGLYPYHLEKKLDLELEVDCGIEINSSITPVAPIEYSQILDNIKNKNKIKIPSSEKIQVLADVICPIKVLQVEAYLEGEGSIFLNYNSSSKKWEGEFPIRDTKTDRDFYKFNIRARAVNQSYSENTHKVCIDTPINLDGFIDNKNNNALLFLDQDNKLKATTTKYANNVKVTILGKTINMTLENDDGKIRTWKANKFVDISLGETTGVAKFVATTKNGNSESKNVNYKTVLPLTITGNVEPTPVWAGYWVTIKGETDGYAEKVELTFKGGKDHGKMYEMTPMNDISQKTNTWEIRYKTWEYEPDGNIPVELKAIRTGKEETTIVDIVIQDSYLDHRKSSVKE